MPAPAIFVAGAVSLYLGAALAVALFDELRPSVVAWLRLVGAAAVLLAWRRPARPAWRGRRLLLTSAFGLATALMNVAFYEAIARLPLGTAVAIEFCGPVVVAAAGSRGWRDAAAVVLAVAGVLLIVDVQWAGTPAGVLLALSAAALWAGYIVLGTRVAGGGDGLDDLAVGLTAGAVLLSPLAAGAGPALTSPRLLVLAAGVGVMSSVLPYALDQVVLRRLGQARFALLLAILPATAAVVGLALLRQVPRPLEAVGIGCVVLAVLLRPTPSNAVPSDPGLSDAGLSDPGLSDPGPSDAAPSDPVPSDPVPSRALPPP
jgi:inner membrane transporter RhtA